MLNTNINTKLGDRRTEEYKQETGNFQRVASATKLPRGLA